MTKIAVLICSFNRRERTLAAISAVKSQKYSIRPEQVDIYLYDDDSTDGTATAVRESFPDVHVIKGSGGAYWAKGMHAAWRASLETSYSYVAWLNDDVYLFDDAMQNLLDCSARHANGAVCVGATRSTHGSEITYSGVMQGRRPLTRSRFVTVRPNAFDDVSVDTFNGNFVLIPQKVFGVVGTICPEFEHGMGDYDYGLRCKKLGFRCIVAPGLCGICDRNSPAGTFQDHQLSIRTRWRHMLSPKGLPWKSWLIFSKRHFGMIWPVYFAWPYLKFWVLAAKGIGWRRA